MTAAPSQDKPRGLDPVASQERLRRLCDNMDAERITAALISAPGHVHYLSGFWSPEYPALLYVTREGESILSAHETPAAEIAVSETRKYESQRLCTLVEDLPAAALAPLLDSIRSHARLGVDSAICPWLFPAVTLHDLGPLLRRLRRRKAPDEVELLRSAVRATEAAYAHARDILKPGLSEFELFAAMRAAAVRTAGEPIGHFGNDFQCNSPGGPARHRPSAAGELAVLDVSVNLRGYSSDLCRTFAVDRAPSQAQNEAHRRIVEVLEHVETTVKPGVSCKRLFLDVEKTLASNENGWEFFHHLGHGIGLSGHEAPRLNPNWDDTFAEGDVFTAEPGLYGPDLKAGIRLEHNYLVTATGVEPLSTFPLDL
jgi:Xaa-Pro dipeptidase